MFRNDGLLQSLDVVHYDICLILAKNHNLQQVNHVDEIYPNADNNMPDQLH